MESFVISVSATCSFYILGRVATSILQHEFMLLFIFQVVMLVYGIELILFFSCCVHRVAFSSECNVKLALLRISSATREYPGHASLPHTSRRYSELSIPGMAGTGNVRLSRGSLIHPHIVLLRMCYPRSWIFFICLIYCSLISPFFRFFSSLL